jgi:tetratricopeptide (TPR) repeat protein
MVHQSQKNSPDSNNNHTVLSVCILLAATVFLVFGRTYWYDFVNFDDDIYFFSNYHVKAGLTGNGALWAFRATDAFNWHPLTWLSLMLDAQLFGTGPAGPHLTNVILHAANAGLLFLLLKRLTGALWPSAFVSAMFALHPLHVESVAWVSERKDVLSGLFFMLTLLMYARYAQNSARSQVSGVRWLGSCDYWLAVLFFALGLMSKPMLVTVPFVLLLLDYWPLHRFDLTTFKRLLTEKLPFLALSTASCIATFLVQSRSGAVHSAKEISMTLRIENAFVSYARYLHKTFWPERLAVPYPHPGIWPWETVVFSIALVFCVGIITLRLAPKAPFLVTGWFWFLGMLVPAIGLIQVGMQSMADRYTYLPLIGVFIMLAWGWGAAFEHWRLPKPAMGSLAVLVLAACTARTMDQLPYWKNSGTLFRHAIEVTEHNHTAYYNLGEYCSENDRLDEAIDNYLKAIQIRPDYYNALGNLGVLLAKRGELDEAIARIRESIRYKPDNTNYYNLGNVLVAQHKLDEAVSAFTETLRLKPDYPEAHNNLANVLLEQGHLDAAIEHFNKAFEFDPDYAEAHFNLANVLARQGKSSDAIGQYQKAIKIKPGYADAHYNLGVVLARQGRLDEAVKQYRKTIGMRPDDVNAHGNLAKVLAAQGKFDEAVKEYQRTVELAPDSAQAHFGFGQALQSQGDIKAAMAEYRRTMELNSKHLPAHLSLAWLLATSPEAALRDGNQAVELAREAERLGGGESPQLLDTLAAAYAEAERYPEAVETAKRAQNLTATQNNQPLAEAIQNRLKLYEAGFPYHEKP